MDYHQTADALDRMAVQQQAMVDASAAFRALGSIEGATNEALTKRDAAVKLLAEATEALNKARQTELDITAACEAKVRAAHDKVDELMSETNAKVKSMFVDARKQADDTAAAAAAQAATILQRAADDTAGLREEAAELRDELAKGEAKVAAINAAADAAEARLNEIKTAIATIAGKV